MIESLVALLLLLTIGYSVLLNKRLKRLRADEMSLKATISELITATEIAERAIGGLKLTVRECDQGLGERLRTAERYAADIARQTEAGLEVLDPLEEDERMARHHRLHAVRAHLLELAGRREEALESYRTAARLATSLPEKRYLEGRAGALRG
jgi:tetratricopeptide (TPR) repeat protein